MNDWNGRSRRYSNRWRTLSDEPIGLLSFLPLDNAPCVEDLVPHYHGFAWSRFIVGVDPLWIVSLPNSLNGASGLVCLPVGTRKDLERLAVEDLVARARVAAHPELDDPMSAPLLAGVGGG